MADRDFDREQRWRGTGFWEDREDEETRREGDRSMARNYGPDDMRRYARRSVEQGERLSRSRGQEPRDRGERETGRGRYDSEDRYGSRYRQRDRSGEYYASTDQGRQQRRAPREGPNYGRDYDYEPNERSLNRGRGFDMDRGPDYGEDRLRRQEPSDYRDFWAEQEPDRGVDQVENYWGKQAQARRYEDRRRPGYESARNPYRGIRRDRGGGGEFEDRGYDMDPGYSYEFGTDFNFMQNASRQEIERRRGMTGEEGAPRQEGRRRDRPRYSDQQQRRGRQAREEQQREAQRRRRELEQKDQWGSMAYSVEDPRDEDNRRRMQREWAGEMDREDSDQRQYSRMVNAEGRAIQPRDARRERFNRSGSSSTRYAGQASHGSGDQRLGRTANSELRGRIGGEPGPYTGIGPAGYRRSDERIMEEACERLTRHGQVDCSKINIQVKGGEVTLSGEVNRKNEKWMAEEAVEHIFGVQNVDNRIKIKRPS